MLSRELMRPLMQCSSLSQFLHFYFARVRGRSLESYMELRTWLDMSEKERSSC